MIKINTVFFTVQDTIFLASGLILKIPGDKRWLMSSKGTDLIKVSLSRLPA